MVGSELSASSDSLLATVAKVAEPGMDLLVTGARQPLQSPLASPSAQKFMRVHSATPTLSQASTTCSTARDLLRSTHSNVSSHGGGSCTQSPASPMRRLWSLEELELTPTLQDRKKTVGTSASRNCTQTTVASAVGPAVAPPAPQMVWQVNSTPAVSPRTCVTVQGYPIAAPCATLEQVIVTGNVLVRQLSTPSVAPFHTYVGPRVLSSRPLLPADSPSKLQDASPMSISAMETSSECGRGSLTLSPSVAMHECRSGEKFARTQVEEASSAHSRGNLTHSTSFPAMNQRQSRDDELQPTPSPTSQMMSAMSFAACESTELTSVTLPVQLRRRSTIPSLHSTSTALPAATKLTSRHPLTISHHAFLPASQLRAIVALDPSDIELTHPEALEALGRVRRAAANEKGKLDVLLHRLRRHGLAPEPKVENKEACEGDGSEDHENEPCMIAVLRMCGP